MAELKTDERSIRAEHAPEAERILVESRNVLFELEFRVARALAEIDAKGAFVLHSCASAPEYAQRLGYDFWRALDLLHLGKAIGVMPAVEAEVREGVMTFGAGSELGKILARPTIPEAEKKEWHDRAMRTPLRVLRRQIKRRLEQERQAGVLRPKTFYVSEETERAFERARTISSQQARRVLSESETFAHVTNDFLDRHDMTLQADGPRRMPDTALTPFGSGIPAEVERAVRRRSGNRCEVPGCHNHAEEFAHIRPRKDGSAREANDFLHLCHRHHLIYDLGLLRFVEWRPDGKPLLEDVSGGLLDRLPPAHDLSDPDWATPRRERSSRGKAQRKARGRKGGVAESGADPATGGSDPPTDSTGPPAAPG